MLRLDTIHPGISGNKWYKLKYNLHEAKQSGINTVLSFGGAFSNHIHALAIAAGQSSLNSIGVIRGERNEPLNPTLVDAEKYGMKLFFISREKYRQKYEDEFISELKSRFGNLIMIPEGGSNKLGIKGASEIVSEFNHDADYLIVPVGTGGTMAGLICGLKGRKKVLGIPVLKGGFLTAEVQKLVADYSHFEYENWELAEHYHFGGYAKFNEKLIAFINDFYHEAGIPLDPIYTGKMMYALEDMVRSGYIHRNSKILAIHTGGLQGIRGFNERHGDLIES